MAAPQKRPASHVLLSPIAIRPRRVIKMPLSLPEEVLQLIFSFLQPLPETLLWHGGSDETALRHRTLAAVCRANKTCQRLATPFLYHTIQIYSQPRYSNPDADLSGFEPNSGLLLESLLGRDYDGSTYILTDPSRPPIGRAVKHMTVEWFELLPPNATEKCKTDMERFLEEGGVRPYLGDTWLPEGVDGMPEDLHQDLDWQFNDAAEAANLPEELVWHLVDAHSTGVEDAEVAMMLMLCRDSLHTLDLTAVPGIRHSLVMDVVEALHDDYQEDKSHDSKAPFHNLHQLSVRGEGGLTGVSTYQFRDLAPFLRLPSLTTLRAHGMQCVVKQDPPRSYPSITRIEVECGNLNPDGLEDILRSCPSLTELEFSVDSPVEDEMDFDEIGQRLQEFGQRLTKVMLSTTDREHSTLPELTRLKNLRHFGASHTLLLGPAPKSGDNLSASSQRELSAALPTNLEVLEILEDRSFDRVWHGEQDDVQIFKLLSDTSFGQLSKVIIHSEGDAVKSTEHLEPMGWTRKATDEVVVLCRTDAPVRSRCDSAFDVKDETQNSARHIQTSLVPTPEEESTG